MFVCLFVCFFVKVNIRDQGTICICFLLFYLSEIFYMNLFLCLLCSLYVFFFKFLDVCLKVLRIFGKLRPCHDQVNIMVIICILLLGI